MLLGTAERLPHVRRPQRSSGFPEKVVCRAFRSISEKPDVCHLTEDRRPSGANAGVARRPGHPRNCRAGVHRHRGAAAWRAAQALCHRSRVSSALRFVPARRSRRAARSVAAAGPRFRRDHMDHARGTPDIGRKLVRNRPRYALAGSLSGVDAAGGGVADDGLACAGGGDGSGFNAGARDARNRRRR